MKKMIVMAGLLAAVSAIPAMAQGWRNGRGEGGVQPRGERANGGIDRSARPQRNVEARAQAPAQVQAPARVQAPRAEWQGRRNFGGGAAAAAPVRVQAQAQAPTRFRDRDGDGIRNRRDADRNGNGVIDAGRRDRDGDGVRNRADRDRDGDGIRNRRDADANGNGRLDARYDRNRAGRIDGRFDRNNNGRIDPRYGYNNGYGRPGNAGNWNRDWRNDRRYDWNNYRNSNRGLFSRSRYYAPYGWNYGYQRFNIGIYLNSLLFSRNYWIDDPYQYRLPPAYPPYRWIRYYNDALLIDERSGYVVDTIYEFFY